MKIVTTPPSAIQACAKMHHRAKKRGEHMAWWVVAAGAIPAQSLMAASTGKGILKPGIQCHLIGSHPRKVFIGPPGQEVEQQITEYVALTNNGGQFLVQVGRDVTLVNENQGVAA